MFVRFTIVSGEKARLDAALDFFEGTGRPRVEATPGNRGFATFAAPDSGTIVGASYWDDEASMLASLDTLGPLREQGAAVAGGSMRSESYEVAVGFRQSIPARGATVRLSRLRVDPARIDQVVEAFREESVPRIKGAAGMCSFQLLVDRVTGDGMVASAWETAQAAEDWWPIAQEIRAQATRDEGVTFGDVEVYSMVATTVQLG